MMMMALLSGIIISGYLVAGLFFLKFWRGTRDSLFLSFAVAFWILAAQRLMLVYFAADDSLAVLLYGVRVLAFSLIIFAIVHKNREAPAG